jgi:hypothetical protein
LCDCPRIVISFSIDTKRYFLSGVMFNRVGVACLQDWKTNVARHV